MIAIFGLPVRVPLRIAPAVDALESLLAQAKRCRFSEPAREARFLSHYIGAALLRSRIALVLGIAAAVIDSSLVWISVLPPSPAHEWVNRVNLGLVLVFSPSLAFTWWKRTQLRFDTWLVVMLVAFMMVQPLFYFAGGQTSWSTVIEGANMKFALITAFVLPIRFGAACGLAAALAFLAPGVMLLARGSSNWIFVGMIGNATIGAIIIAAGLQRERDARRLFVQREHLAELNAELTRLHAERGEFMAIAAHDLQAPLNAVKLTAGLALTEPDARGPLRDMLADIAGAAARMGDIVTSFLRSHAAERGDLPVQLAPLALAEAAAAALRRHAAAAQAKHQPLTFTPPAAPLAPAHADAALLAQALDNFLSNAIKFTPAGGAITLHAGPGEAPHTVRLAVRDQGPGLSETDKARAFTKFARLTAQPTAGEASTGLGLAVARRLVTAMGGTVGVADAPDGGADFWIELPVAPASGRAAR